MLSMKIPSEFNSRLTKTELALGIALLVAHVLVFPILFAWAVTQLAALPNLPAWLSPLFETEHATTVTSMLAQYLLTFILCFFIFRRFLRREFDVFFDSPIWSVMSIISGYFLMYILSIIFSLMLVQFFDVETITAMVEGATSSSEPFATGTLFALNVFLGPFIFEPLFRGIIFGAIRKKNRTLAYAVSIFAFSAYYVLPLAVSGLDWKVAFFAVQQIPAGFALARTYERTNSIWPPIFLHMIVNAMTLLGIF